jgi:hypothetical protein
MRLLANNTKLLVCLAIFGWAFSPNRIKAAEDKIAGTIALETATDRLLFDRSSGRLVSLRGRHAPEVELLATSPDHPAFAIRYFDKDRADHLLDSRSVKGMSVDCSGPAEDKTLTLRYSGVGGFDLDLALTVHTSTRDRFSRWSASVRNGAGLSIVDVQFPFVVVPRGRDGTLVLPTFRGSIRKEPTFPQLPDDGIAAWRLTDNYREHYPGGMFAQFLAWYTARGGVYIACNDTQGNIKVLKTLKRDSGIRLGIAHAGDWPARGQRKLEYEVLLGSFSGDWYDAADLYRDWTLRQKWATPLGKRRDIPKWLLDSPVYVTVRPQSYDDDTSTLRIKEFLPYEKCIPLLDQIAQGTKTPVCAVLMGWERPGSWIYPDSFPPVGGEQSLVRFIALARQRGWHVGSYCNGPRWITTHSCGYDGREYFKKHHGEETVCRNEPGRLFGEDWGGWRYTYLCCIGHPRTRQIATDFVKHLIDWGMESIQFLDQDDNAVTYACFSAQHGHPPMVGKWMNTAMADLLKSFRQAAGDAHQSGVIQSAESACNEYCLPLLQECDVRIDSPSTSSWNDGTEFVPIYHYLFHECIVTHGMFGVGPTPCALQIRTAWNGVWGQLLGGIMTGDGTFLNQGDKVAWSRWDLSDRKNNDVLEMIRTVSAIRRGAGRDFLVYGRMQHPANVSGVDMVKWKIGDRQYAVPAVAHAAWQAPDGRYGVVLTNWTKEDRSVAVAAPRLGSSPTLHVCGRKTESSAADVRQGGCHVTVPSLGCALIVNRDRAP